MPKGYQHNKFAYQGSSIDFIDYEGARYLQGEDSWLFKNLPNPKPTTPAESESSMWVEIPRYSPKTVHEYGCFVDGSWLGPACSSLLRSDPAAWNLAYLSHDYDLQPINPSFPFIDLIQDTLSVPIDPRDLLQTGNQLSSRPSFRDLLRLPPWEFVGSVRLLRNLASLPLYDEYGHDWFETIEFRSKAVPSRIEANLGA